MLASIHMQKLTFLITVQSNVSVKRRLVAGGCCSPSSADLTLFLCGYFSFIKTHAMRLNPRTMNPKARYVLHLGISTSIQQPFHRTYHAPPTFEVNDVMMKGNAMPPMADPLVTMPIPKPRRRFSHWGGTDIAA